MSNVQEVINEADRRAAVATEGVESPDAAARLNVGEMSADTAERLSMSQILDRGALPVLSQVGRPLICPTCGGASNYVQRMSMEGRACLYTTAGKSSKVLAWYCGEHERQNQVFDVNLLKDRQQVDVEGWNLEVLDAVRGMAKHVVRDTMNARAIMAKATEYMGALEAQLAEKTTALLAAQKRERKLLAAVAPAKVKGKPKTTKKGKRR